MTYLVTIWLVSSEVTFTTLQRETYNVKKAQINVTNLFNSRLISHLLHFLEQSQTGQGMSVTSSVPAVLLFYSLM